MASVTKCLKVTQLKLSLPIHGYRAGCCCSPVDSHSRMLIHRLDMEMVVLKLLLIPAKVKVGTFM